MEYRSYIPGDDDEAVLDLRAAVWGAEHPHNNPRFLHWLLADNPAGSGSGILMEDRGKLLGFAAILPRCVEIGGVVRTAAQCVDYMVHPGARATAGAFRIMAEWQRLARDLGFEFGDGLSKRQFVSRRDQPKTRLERRVPARSDAAPVFGCGAVEICRAQGPSRPRASHDGRRRKGLRNARCLGASCQARRQTIPHRTLRCSLRPAVAANLGRIGPRDPP